MKDETMGLITVGTPLSLLAMGMGICVFYISNILPFMASYLFIIPALLIMGTSILIEGFEKSSLIILIPLLIYSAIFGLVMLPAFLVVWEIMVLIIYLFRRESEMNFNIR